MLLDQLAVDARQRDLGVVRSTPPRRPSRTPRRPAARSAAPPARPRCTTPPRAIVRVGGIDSRAAAPPPAHPRCSPSVENSVSGVALGHAAARTRRYTLSASRLIARHDLDLAAFQAGRDLEPLELDALALRPRAASRRSPTRGSRTGAASAARTPSRPRAPRAARRVCDRRAPHRLQLARRARAARPRSGRSAAASRRRHHQPGRGADRLEHGRAARHRRLLAVARRDRLRVDVRPALQQRAHDLCDALRERLVEHHLAALEARRRPRP